MRVLVRKVGKERYHYLQHSFRKDGKVITKEIYLGKEIPADIEITKKAFVEECRKEKLYGLFERIKKGSQKEWKRYPKSVKEKTLEQVAIAFTYNTNAIEGSTITLQETRELVEHSIAPNRSLKDIKETEAHVKVFLGMLKKREPIVIGLILKWHKSLFQETKPDIAGKFRHYLVRVGGYIAPDWQDVKKLMRELVEFYENNKKKNAIELAARMHYNFEKIHPFGDGNGRVGRLLMNYILWQNGYPMLIIEYKKRKAYYKALEKNEEAFINYFTKLYIKVHKKYLSRRKR